MTEPRTVPTPDESAAAAIAEGVRIVGYCEREITYPDHNAVNHYDRPIAWSVDAAFATADERDAFVARFPKSVGFRTSTCSHGLDVVTYRASAGSKLRSDGVNGGRNETGIKRLASFLRSAEKLGVGFSYAAPYSNSYPSLDALLAAVAS